MSTVELRFLDAFSRQLSHTLSDSRDLNLLGQIQQTVELVADRTVQYQSLVLMMEHYIDIVQKATLSSPEVAQSLERAFLSAADSVELFYNKILAQRQSAIDDSRLTADDGVVDAYDALIEQVSATYNCANQMAWILGEHLAEFDETLPGKFDTAEALFEAMGV
jgi:hypothetical protein